MARGNNMGDQNTDDLLAEQLADGSVLTERQAQTKALVMRGASDAEVADKLGITRSTVESHIRRGNRRIQKAQEVLGLVDMLQNPRDSD